MATTTERGYGHRHQQARKAWEPKVKAGGVMCARQGPNCTGQPIDPDQPWDLGHDDNDRSKYNGPECIPCNRGTGGRNGAAASHSRRPAMVIREW